MQTQNTLPNRRNARHSNVVEPRCYDNLLKAMARMSLQDNQPHQQSPTQKLRPPPIDLKSKHMAEYTTDAKSMPSGRSAPSKRSRKSQKSADFDVRFLFYDRLLPIFQTCKLPDRCFFRLMALVERSLPSRQNSQLDTYKDLKQRGTFPDIEDKFYKCWFREFALPALVMAIENEIPDSKPVLEAVFYYVQSRPDLYPFNMSAEELIDKKVAIFVWNDCQIDDLTHYHTLSAILRTLGEEPSSLALLQSVAEKVLIVNLCFQYDMYCLSAETVCQAVVHFCLCSLDEAFKKFLSDSSRLTPPEKNRVKALYQSLKKLRRLSKTVDLVLVAIQDNLAQIRERDEGANFREWKFELPESSSVDSSEPLSPPADDPFD